MSQPADVIFDTDPGKDDAFALFLALAVPERLNLVAITAAAGNLSLDVTVAAARRIVEAAGRSDIPVYAGCPTPLMNQLDVIPQVHGHDGLGGSGLPDMVCGPEPDHAVIKLIDLIDNATRPLTVAAIAPLTNLAVVFAMRPDLAGKLERLVVMGGSRGRGNMTDHAEFNIHIDPHAAQIVLASGVPIVLVPLDVTRPTLPDAAWFRQFAELGAAGQAIAGMWHDRPLPLHDVTVTAFLLWPELFTTERCHVSVELNDSAQLAKTHIEPASAGAIEVVSEINRERLYEHIEKTLRNSILL